MHQKGHSWKHKREEKKEESLENEPSPPLDHIHQPFHLIPKLPFLPHLPSTNSAKHPPLPIKNIFLTTHSHHLTTHQLLITLINPN